MRHPCLLACVVALGSLAARDAVAQAPRQAGGRADSLALVRQWDAKLRGQRATMLSRVNGGQFGGGTWRTDFYFCKDGRVIQESESSVSVDVGGANGSSGGRERHEGRWRVIVAQGIPALQVTQRSDTGYVGIGWNEQGHTFFSGQRVYVTAENDRC